LNREIIIGALFAKLTGPPLVVNFTADTMTGDVALANVSDPAGLMVGMPVTGDGLAADTVITTLTPAVTLSQPATADRTASAITQGFQTTERRLADPSEEQDMPALYLVELSEVYPPRDSGRAAMVEINTEAWIYTRVGATENAIPAAMINTLLDAVEAALRPEIGFQQQLGVYGVHSCRIEGEILKEPGHHGQIGGAIIPIKILVGQSAETYLL
jgi:hypothetical protein